MAELNVSRKTIGKLFSEMQGRKFIIPEYQRPYKWDKEKCETLWDDIQHFAQTEAKEGMEYFLGTIVCHINDEKNLDIIDGQQRITSFLLLLRAFYKKLENMPDDADVKGLKNQIAPCIWDINPISQEVSDRSQIHILSKVVTEKDNDKFHNILEYGTASDDADDNYSKNFLFFKRKCDDYAQENPMQWKELCITILQKCIILPIECDTQDTALTIFSTLNDRGLPLADSDIFKAQMYHNYKSEEERKIFTEKWKELTKICNDGDLRIDEVFRYYSHYLRAKKNDKSKEKALRKFYSEGHYEILKSPKLLADIIILAKFWCYLNSLGEMIPDDYHHLIDSDSLQYIHVLSQYPNEYWKYPVSVFFLQNKDEILFQNSFNQLLKALISFLFIRFINNPSVNAIKDEIFSICIDLYQKESLSFKNTADFHKIIEKSNNIPPKLVKAILLLHAYLDKDQTLLIPKKFDIEHIFPKKWQKTNYNGWNRKDAEEYLDKIGNKIVLEKKLNIQAGNGYFGQKKLKYQNSSIATVQKLGKYPKDDWLKQDIDDRNKNIKNDLMNFFKTNLP